MNSPTRQRSQESTNAETLRRRAEDLLRMEPDQTPTLPTTDVQYLINELNVFQMELELQNEELRRSQVELTEARDRYTALYEEAPVGYLSVNAKGEICGVNRNAEKLLDKASQELIARPVTQCFSEDSRFVLYSHLEALFRDGKKQRCEVTCRHPDGNVRNLLLESTLMPWESEPRCHMALVDVTERYCFEQELQHLNQTLEKRVLEQTQQVRLLAEAVAHLGEGVVITEGSLDWPGPPIVFANEAMCRISGYRQDELIGKPPVFLRGEEGYRELLTKLRQCEAEQRPCGMELLSFRKDGTPYYCDVFITPLLNEAGAPTHFVGIIRDISARKQADQELQQREEWMRAILDNASDALIIVDHEGTIVRVNPATETMFDYQRAELIDLPLADLIPAESTSDDPLAASDNSLAASLHFLGKTRELTGRKKEGRRFPVEVSGNQVDHLPFFVCIVRDISERKKAALALVESQQRFDLAIRGSADGIWDWTDVAQDDCWWSPRFFELLGYQPGEIHPSQNTLHQLLHPDDRQRILKAIDEHLVDGIRFDVEYRLRTKSGKYRWFRARAHVLRDEHGKALRMTGCLEDIENRKQIEESLRREHELSDSIIENCPAIVMVLDPRGKVLRFNRFAEKITGWSVSEVVGKDWIEMFIRPEDQALILELFQQAVYGTQTKGYVNKVLAKDGGELDIEWFDAPLTGSTGEFVGLVCIGQDITERRALEREVLEIAAEEQRRIGSDLHDGVCQQLTGLGMLAEGLAELLRTQADQASNGPPATAEKLSAVRSPADLQEVARQLSEGLGKATADTRALSHGLIPVDIDAEGLRAALEELSRSVERLKKVDCRFDSYDEVQVENNYVANHLYRIAQEAVANAMRHGAPKQIVISLQEQDGQVVLRIYDDGVGITPTESPHDGMGLRIMKHRASMIGAALSVLSPPHSGTTIECRCIKRRTQGGEPSSASLSWGEPS